MEVVGASLGDVLTSSNDGKFRKNEGRGAMGLMQPMGPMGPIGVMGGSIGPKPAGGQAVWQRPAEGRNTGMLVEQQ